MSAINTPNTPLTTIRSYIAWLTWFEGGALTSDMTYVIDYLESTPDSRWVVAESRRCKLLVNFWSERLRYRIRSQEIEVLCKRDSLDKPSRDLLGRSQRQIKQRSIDATTYADPVYRRLVDDLQQYEQALAILSSIDDLFDPALIVQDTVSARKQEEMDNLTP